MRCERFKEHSFRCKNKAIGRYELIAINEFESSAKYLCEKHYGKLIEQAKRFSWKIKELKE